MVCKGEIKSERSKVEEEEEEEGGKEEEESVLVP